MTKYHRKTDGILMVRPDGMCRFLSFWEMLGYRLFGIEPGDSRHFPVTKETDDARA